MVAPGSEAAKKKALEEDLKRIENERIEAEKGGCAVM
jgi:hypothetical protein